MKSYNVVVRACQWLLKPAVKLQKRLPAAFFSRFSQVAIDVFLTALSLFLGYQLRFDAAVPPETRRTMYLWLLLLPAVRSLLMWRVGVYQMTWRYFNFHDALQMTFGAMLGTVLMLGSRVGFYRTTWLANPLSVIVIEAAIFVILANMARGLRRAITEESLFSTEDRTRLLLERRDKSLPAALYHIAGYRKLDVVGLFVPGCEHN